VIRIIKDIWLGTCGYNFIFVIVLVDGGVHILMVVDNIDDSFCMK
jgi:hypothetical protein